MWPQRSEGLLSRPESLPGTFAGRGKGQAPVGPCAFGRCVQGEPRDFPSAPPLLPSSPVAITAFLIAGTFLQQGDLHWKWCLLGP